MANALLTASSSASVMANSSFSSSKKQRTAVLVAADGRGAGDCNTPLVASTSSYTSSRRLLGVRIVAVGSLVLGSSVVVKGANAAKRRPPPSAEQGATKEKTDPNMSAVQAKVLASIKRKEAMKEAVAKLKEKGKPLDQLQSSPL